MLNCHSSRSGSHYNFLCVWCSLTLVCNPLLFTSCLSNACSGLALLQQICCAGSCAWLQLDDWCPKCCLLPPPWCFDMVKTKPGSRGRWVSHIWLSPPRRALVPSSALTQLFHHTLPCSWVHPVYLWVHPTSPNAIPPHYFLWEVSVWTQMLSKGLCLALAVSGERRLNWEEVYSHVKITFQPSQQHLLGLFSRAYETSFLSDKMLHIPRAHHAPGLGGRVRQVMQKKTGRLLNASENPCPEKLPGL